MHLFCNLLRNIELRVKNMYQLDVGHCHIAWMRYMHACYANMDAWLTNNGLTYTFRR